MIAWLRRLRRGRLVDEICRCCYTQLHDGDAWETVEHHAPIDGESMFGGGTFGTAYWCRRHRPADAHRVKPGTLPPG